LIPLRRVSETFCRSVQIERDLKIHPEFGGSFQSAGEKDCSLGGDVALAVDEGIDTLDRHTHPAGQFDLGHIQGLEKFLQEDFSGMRRDTIFGNHGDLCQ
jgi:hypothetical protein